MEEERQFHNDLSDLESALRDLTPLPARTDTALTLYLAGQQSVVRRQRWQRVWPVSTACLAVTCAALAFLVAWPDRDALRTSSSPRSVATPSSEPSSQQKSRNAVQPDSVAVRSGGSERNIEPSVPPRAVAWSELASRLQIQQQLLGDNWEEVTADAMPEDPVNIETVSSADWPAWLTEASVGERFRYLSQPLRQPPAAFQYLTNIFPTRGS